MLLIVASLAVGWLAGMFGTLCWMRDEYPTAFSALTQEMKWRKAERQTEKAKQEGEGER